MNPGHPSSRPRPIHCSSGAFGYLNHYLWWRVARWLRKRHGRLSWKELQRKVFTDRYRIVAGGIESIQTLHRAPTLAGIQHLDILVRNSIIPSGMNLW